MAYKSNSTGRESASEALLDRDEPPFDEADAPGDTHFGRAKYLLGKHLGVHLGDHVEKRDGWSHLVTGLKTAAACRNRGDDQEAEDRPMLAGDRGHAGINMSLAGRRSRRAARLAEEQLRLAGHRTGG